MKKLKIKNRRRFKKWVIVVCCIIAFILAMTIYGGLDMAKYSISEIPFKGTGTVHGLQFNIPQGFKKSKELGYGRDAKAFVRNVFDGKDYETFEMYNIIYTGMGTSDSFDMNKDVDREAKNLFNQAIGHKVKDFKVAYRQHKLYIDGRPNKCKDYRFKVTDDEMEAALLMFRADGTNFVAMVVLPYDYFDSDDVETIFENIYAGDYINNIDKPLDITNIKYTGVTRAGTKIEYNNEYTDFVGDVRYENGIVRGADLYMRGKAITLKPDGVYTVMVGKAGLYKPCKVVCSTMSASHYKSICKFIGNSTLIRNPDKYIGHHIKFSGEIIQDIGDGTYLLCYTSGAWGLDDNFVLVESGANLVENDKVSVYGTYVGKYTYENAIGTENTVPWIHAKYVDFK